MEKLAKDLFGSIINIGGVDKRCNVVAFLKNQETGEERAYPGANIVTDAGDLYYAQKAAAETPDINFAAGGFRLGTSTQTPGKDSTDVDNADSNGNHAIFASYPMTDDGDTDNTGAGADIVTWKAYYNTTEGNITGITGVAIVDSTSSPTAALCHASFSSFDKTSSDTLTIYVNHQFNGS